MSDYYNECLETVKNRFPELLFELYDRRDPVYLRSNFDTIVQGIEHLMPVGAQVWTLTLAEAQSVTAIGYLELIKRSDETVKIAFMDVPAQYKQPILESLALFFSIQELEKL